MNKIVILMVVFMAYGMTVCAADGDLIVGGKLGVGTMPDPSSEKLEVDGAVTLGTTTGTKAGTIRWTGTNFQGFNGTAWVNLDAASSATTGYTGTIVTINNGYTYTQNFQNGVLKTVAKVVYNPPW